MTTAPSRPAAKQLFGRRKGKKLRTHHAALMQELLPQVEILPGNDPVDVSSMSGFKGRALHLEIGFGGGEHLAHIASRLPDCGFVGCEPFVNGVAKLLAEIAARSLDNIRLFPGDARELLPRLPDNCFERIYLLYPDPWPKSRQKKRRIIAPEFLRHIARLLKPEGEFRFATDIDDYCAWTLRHVLHAGAFEWANAGHTRWNTPWPDWMRTRYEEKAIAEGRKPVYLIFKKTCL